LIGGGQANAVYAASYNTALVRYIDFMDSYFAKGGLCHVREIFNRLENGDGAAFVKLVAAASIGPSWGRTPSPVTTAKRDPQDCWLGNPAGQRGGLLHPRRHLRLVELVVFMDVEVAHFLVLGLAGRD
jgi:hypothetical protein